MMVVTWRLSILCRSWRRWSCAYRPSSPGSQQRRTQVDVERTP